MAQNKKNNWVGGILPTQFEKKVFTLYCLKIKNIMNWLILIAAGLFETAFALCLGKAKASEGTEMYLWYSGFVIALAFSMLLLIKAPQNIPIGTAYAVWTGIGAAGTVLVGIILFKESVNFWRIFFIFTLIASIVGLKAASH
jgi:quaternary ammonium compound-resistance protein SugE